MKTYNSLLKTLEYFLYTRVDKVNDYQQYMIKGDSIIITIPNTQFPYHISFFDQEVETIKILYDDRFDNKEKSAYENLISAQSKLKLFEILDNCKEWVEVIVQLQSQINVGEYVVHEDHGVAKFKCFSERDGYIYFLLQYSGEDRLYIPISQLHRITKYLGPDGVEPRVTKLSGGEWSRIMRKVKESTALIAKELLLQMALRELSEAPSVKNDNIKNSDYELFAQGFQYVLTDDQEKCIEEIRKDLLGRKTHENFTFDENAIGVDKLHPMNRLLIGDVGFGKTEVALRAAFTMVESGYQICVLCPTTVLASQQFKTFQSRFETVGAKVGVLSSFRTNAQNEITISNLERGNIDIIVGTHRLLSNDIKFKNLGLIIIDEEQKFGVKQKEKLKSMRFGVHILSMSATPIPRTLSMALSKLQDISIIASPPPGRKPVETKIITSDYKYIVELIQKELNRNGQVFFIHNSIQTIHSIQSKLKIQNPNLRIVVGYSHSPNLEENIVKFDNKEYDVFLCTTILENGIDMPNVNTIFINKAENYGLSQLYQLRGRVGRSDRQAYCYLISEAQDNERLFSMVDNQHLGAGFDIAQKDLELRGAGNILGSEQSGNINLVGYGLYMKLLEEEIIKLKEGITKTT